MNSLTQAIDSSQRLQQARSFLQQRNYGEAMKLYAQLAKESPTPDVLTEYGAAAGTAGDFELADQAWEKALGAQPNSASLLMRIAGEYGKIWLFAKARALSHKAAELEPNNFDAQMSLAAFLARTNSVEEARDAVERCLKLDPRSEPARYFSAQVDRRENKLNQAEQQLRDMFKSGIRDEQVACLCHFELARILDKMERFDEAIAELDKAREISARTIKVTGALKTYDERRKKILEVTKNLPKNILEIWSNSFPPSVKASSPQLVFLGGHARSGTTLLERILDAHPSVAACDEPLAFQTISPYIDLTVPQLPANGLNLLRQRYIKNLTKVLGSPAQNCAFVDKNPAVTPYLAPFLRVFPDLKVLIALRDPRDVIISCYFENLVPISLLNIAGLAQHYARVMDVWLAIREWDGLAWMETRYEDIVTNLEGEGTRVTKFLGLEWHENQALFHEKNREKPVMSPNYSDVTKPVYGRAVGRWQAYEKYLAPVLPLLEPYCKEFRYM